jgi:hypothetical protein
VNASLAGQISPTEASALMQALAVQSRAIAAEELESRLKVLEKY